MESHPTPNKAGFIILRPHRTRYFCLILRAYTNWGFAKGEIEKGEDPLAAAFRETKEETSLVDLDLHWGPIFVQTPSSFGTICRYYMALTNGVGIHLPISPELGHPEHHEFRWVGFDEAKSMLAPKLKIVVNWCEAVLSRNDVEKENAHQ